LPVPENVVLQVFQKPLYSHHRQELVNYPRS